MLHRRSVADEGHRALRCGLARLEEDLTTLDPDSDERKRLQREITAGRALLDDAETRVLDLGGATVTFAAPDSDGDGEPYWKVETPTGLNVMITRSEKEYGGQLMVSIRTEAADSEDHDEDGCPFLRVSVNDGDVYDKERHATTVAAAEGDRYQAMCACSWVSQGDHATSAAAAEEGRRHVQDATAAQDNGRVLPTTDRGLAELVDATLRALRERAEPHPELTAELDRVCDAWDVVRPAYPMG